MHAENAQSTLLLHRQIAALRDFFASTNSEDLQNAYGRLGGYHDTHATNWCDVEYTFNRLFVGPMSVPAPLYASVYLEPEPQMMGRTTLEVRELYHELSLTAPSLNSGGVLPDDHISLELDAVLALLAVEDWCHGLDGPSAVETECRMHLSWLLAHMATWVPLFTEKTHQINENITIEHDAHDVIQEIMTILSNNIENLYSHYGRISHENHDIL